MDESREELEAILQYDELKDAVLLIFANKQDLSGAMTVIEIADKFDLHKKERIWYIKASCAIDGGGLYEGLEWLSQHMNKIK